MAIQVEHLSKRYRIGLAQERHDTLRDALVAGVKAPFRRLRRNGGAGEEAGVFWALRDVSFGVENGEVIGIIGRNGAGKSTLLKILSRITDPTEGRAVIEGRVGSLLEVGTGFHPELTGRENIYLNGAILGMHKAEIEKKFDEIVAFAEIDRFLDTPVKRYSSGMYVRLAFAVAAHLETEILLVDEVLAVGDAAFQKKCLGKMGNVAREGRTVLFVSHNMAAVESMCHRVVWLDHGKVAMQDETGTVIGKYLEQVSSAYEEQTWPDPATAPGNDDVRLHAVRLRPADGARPDQLTVATPFDIEFEYWNRRPDVRLNLSLTLYNQEGVIVFVTTTATDAWYGREFPVGLYKSVCRVPSGLLNDGMYRAVLRVVRDLGVVLYQRDDVIAFQVHDTPEGRGGYYGKWPGVTRPSLPWATELLESEQTEILTTSI
ncbi:MAG: ABC transporter ATP-binding protein [Anaerolineae bacterium]